MLYSNFNLLISLYLYKKIYIQICKLLNNKESDSYVGKNLIDISLIFDNNSNKKFIIEKLNKIIDKNILMESHDILINIEENCVKLNKINELKKIMRNYKDQITEIHKSIEDIEIFIKNI